MRHALLAGLVFCFLSLATTAQESPRFVPPVGHGAEVTSVAFSNSGKWALSGAEDKTARLWEAATGREVRRFVGHTDRVTTVVFAPDEKQVFTASGDKTIRVWDMATGREVRRFEGHEEEVVAIALSRDGLRLASCGQDKTLRYWDVATGRELRKLEQAISPYTLALSPDGKWALCAPENDVLLWDMETGQQVRALRGSTEGVSALAFSPDGKLALGGSHDKMLRLWDVATGRMLRVFRGHEGEVGGACFSADGRFVLSGGWDKTARLWDVATGRQLRVFSGPTAEINSVAFRPDGQQVLTGSWNKVVQLWETSSGRPLRAFGGFVAGITALAASPDGRQLLSASWSRNFRLWDTSTGRPLRAFSGHTAGLNAVAFDTAGKWALSGANDNSLRLWEVATGREGRRFTGHEEAVNAVAFNRSGTQAASASADGSVRLWDVATGREVRRFNEHKRSVRAVAFSPDGQQLLSTGEDNAVRLWEAATGREVRRFALPKTPWPLDSVAFNADGRFALSGGRDGIVRLWEVATGREVRQFVGHEHYILAVAFSPDEKLILSGSWDGTARLWDVATGREVRRFSGHDSAVNTAVFAAQGRFVVSGSDDGTVKLWDVASGRELFTYVALGDDWLAYSSDGRFDGSPGGMAKVHFARGLETFALEQFSEQFFTPGLVPLLLRGEALPGPQTDLQAALAKGAPPLVKIAVPAAAQAQIEVAVEAMGQNGGGIKTIRLFHNGRLVGGPSELRGIALEEAGGETLTKRFLVDLSPGENRLRAVAFSRTDVESTPAEKTLIFNATQPAKPVLHVLAVGVNKYEDARMNLTYARPDAEAMAKFFREQGGGLFREVKITALLDEAATKTAIVAALENIGRGSALDDVVCLYFAGHGETAPQSDAPDAVETFYFLPHEARQMAMAEKVRQYGLSGTEVNQLLGAEKMKARKVFLIYDACKSGAALPGQLRGAAIEQKGLQLLAYAQGIHVLTAATAQQYAGEIEKLGHGILTFALLEGLRGQAAHEGLVKVGSLNLWVDTRVPELTAQYRSARQYPDHFSRGQDFPLAAPK